MGRLVLITLVWAVQAFSQSVHYRVAMPDPGSHLFHIEMEIENPGGESMDLGLPAWNATYVIRNFAQFLQDFDANVPAMRIDKQTWRIEPGTETSVRVRYTIYANQKSPFSSELNEQHAFFNNANLLLLWKQKRDLAVTLEVEPPQGWAIATSLPPTARENVFHADDYDHLVDSPVDVGNLDRHSFTVRGVPVHVIVDGAHRDYDADELVSVLERIVAGHVDLMRDVPFDHLNEDYAKKGRYFEDDHGVARAITEVTGLDLDEIYTDFVHRTVELPYAEYLAYAGLELVEGTGQGGAAGYEIREMEEPSPKQLAIRESWLSGGGG